MVTYEEIYQDLCSRYSAEDVQGFFDTIERRIRDRVALEVVRVAQPDARFVTVPSSGGEREVTLGWVAQQLRDRSMLSAAKAVNELQKGE